MSTPADTDGGGALAVPDGKRATDSPAMRRRHIGEAWTVIKSSVLFKKSKGFRSSWLSRFWVLYSSGDLVYYSDEASVGGSGKCAVVAQLGEKSVEVLLGRANCRDSSYPGIVPDVCCLEFVTAGRTFHIYAITSEDARAWKSAVENFSPSGGGGGGGSGTPGATPSKSPSTSSSLGASPLSAVSSPEGTTATRADEHDTPHRKAGVSRIRSFNLGQRASFFRRDKGQKPARRAIAEAPPIMVSRDASSQEAPQTTTTTTVPSQVAAESTSSSVPSSTAPVPAQESNGGVASQDPARINAGSLPVVANNAAPHSESNVKEALSEASLANSSNAASSAERPHSESTTQAERTVNSTTLSDMAEELRPSTPAGTAATATSGSPNANTATDMPSLDEEQLAGRAPDVPVAALSTSSTEAAGHRVETSQPTPEPTAAPAAVPAVLPPPPGAAGRRKSRQADAAPLLAVSQVHDAHAQTGATLTARTSDIPASEPSASIVEEAAAGDTGAAISPSMSEPPPMAAAPTILPPPPGSTGRRRSRQAEVAPLDSFSPARDEHQAPKDDCVTINATIGPTVPQAAEIKSDVEAAAPTPKPAASLLPKLLPPPPGASGGGRNRRASVPAADSEEGSTPKGQAVDSIAEAEVVVLSPELDKPSAASSLSAATASVNTPEVQPASETSSDRASGDASLAVELMHTPASDLDVGASSSNSDHHQTVQISSVHVICNGTVAPPGQTEEGTGFDDSSVLLSPGSSQQPEPGRAVQSGDQETAASAQHSAPIMSENNSAINDVPAEMEKSTDDSRTAPIKAADEVILQAVTEPASASKETNHSHVTTPEILVRASAAKPAEGTEDRNEKPIDTDQLSASETEPSLHSNNMSTSSLPEQPPVFQSKMEQERWEMQQVEERQARYRRMSSVQRRDHEAKQNLARQRAQLKREQRERERLQAEEQQRLLATHAEMEAIAEMRQRQEAAVQQRMKQLEDDRKKLADEEQQRLRKASSGPGRKMSVRKTSSSAVETAETNHDATASADVIAEPPLARRGHKSSVDQQEKVEAERHAAEEMDRKISERRATLSRERELQRDAARRKKEAVLAEQKQQELQALEEQKLLEEKRRMEMTEKMALVARQQKEEEERIMRERQQRLEAERLQAEEHEARITNVRSNIFLEQEKARRKREAAERLQEEEEERQRLEKVKALERQREEERAEQLRLLASSAKPRDDTSKAAIEERQKQFEMERLALADLERQRAEKSEEKRLEHERRIAAREQERLSTERRKQREEEEREAAERAAEERRRTAAAEDARNAQVGRLAHEHQQIEEHERQIEAERRRVAEFDAAVARQKSTENKEEQKRLERERERERVNRLEATRATEELERRMAEKRLADEAFRSEEAKLASIREKERALDLQKQLLDSERKFEEERLVGAAFEQRLTQLRGVLAPGKTNEEVTDDIEDLDAVARRNWESQNSPMMVMRRLSVRHPGRKPVAEREVSKPEGGETLSVKSPLRRAVSGNTDSTRTEEHAKAISTEPLKPAASQDSNKSSFLQDDPLKTPDEANDAGDESSPSVHAARLMWQNRTGGSPQSSPSVRRSSTGSQPFARSPGRAGSPLLAPRISVDASPDPPASPIGATPDPLSPRSVAIPSPLARSRNTSGSGLSMMSAAAATGPDAEIREITGQLSSSSSAQASAVTSPFSPPDDTAFKFPPAATKNRIAAIRGSSARVRRNSLPTVECPKSVSAPRPSTPVLARVSHLASDSEGESSGGEEDASARRQRQATKWVEKELTKLINAISETSQSVDGEGKPTITFEQLFDVASDNFEALSGTLLTARKHKIVLYDGDLLLQGVHNMVVIILLEQSVPDGASSSFIKQRKSSLAPDSPRRGRAFSGESLQSSQSKCFSCDKTVYPVEFVGVDDRAFHKACFKCLQCQVKLSAGNYATLGGRYYCKTHYERLYKEKGDYSLM